MVRSLHTGPDDTIRAMLALPQTIHDVSGSAEKFCIDAWPIGQDNSMQLFLCVHGEFAEGKYPRSDEVLRSLIYSISSVTRNSIIRP